MKICILTDCTAMFPSHPSTHGGVIRSLTVKTVDGKLAPPTVDDFSHAYNELEGQFSHILVLSGAEGILPAAESARDAAKSHGGVAHISVLDTGQTGVGVGLLAQLGAQAAAEGASLPEIENSIRVAIPNLYTLICSGLETLLDESESGRTAQMMTLEDGELVPYKKIRTRRHLLETLQEFMDEFEHPRHIVYSRGRVSIIRTRPLRDSAGSLFPHIPFREMENNLAINLLFGQHTVGLTIMETP